MLLQIKYLFYFIEQDDKGTQKKADTRQTCEIGEEGQYEVLYD